MRSAWTVVLLLAACGGDGDPRGSGAIGGERTGAELVASRGAPALFSMECTSRRYDAATASWVDGGRVMRVDQWLYPVQGGHDVYVLVNGIIVDARRGDRDLSAFPGAALDPRRFGCGELRSTVASVLGLREPRVTTIGSEQEATLLTLDPATRIEGDYYARDGAPGLLLMTLNGDEVIGMVTL